MKKLAGIVFFVLIGVGVGGFYWYYTLPKPQTSYYGISLFDTKADVEYKLGIPPHVVGPEISSGSMGGWAPVYDVFGNSSSDKNALAPDTDFKTFNSWDYDNPNSSVGYLDISFSKSGQVDTITCFSNNHLSGSCTPILGVNIGDTEERAHAVLGKPTADHLEDVSKSLLYKKLNLIVMLSKQRVYSFEIGTHFDQK